MSESYISGGNMIGPAPNMDNRAAIKSLEDKVKWLGGNRRYGVDKMNDKFDIFNDYVFAPILAELTNQTGLLHHTYVWRSGDSFNRKIDSVALLRTRPNKHSFLNWLARIFLPDEEVLSIEHTGQLWCIKYKVPQYFVTAEQIKEIYYSKMKDSFGGHDMVIVNG